MVEADHSGLDNDRDLRLKALSSSSKEFKLEFQQAYTCSPGPPPPPAFSEKRTHRQRSERTGTRRGAVEEGAPAAQSPSSVWAPAAPGSAAE